MMKATFPLAIAALFSLSGCGGSDSFQPSTTSTGQSPTSTPTSPPSPSPTPTPTPTVTASPSTSQGTGLPKYVLGTYWLNETPGQIRLKDVDPQYNVIYLFAARPLGGAPSSTGAITWRAPTDPTAAANLVADIALVRSSGRRVLLSIGGYNQNVVLDTRARSQAFIDSFEAIYSQLGGVDGLDWDNYEGSDNPNIAEMTWIGVELKKRHGGFIITSPPAPWSQVDLRFCAALWQAGALDYCAPQFYDGADHTDPGYIARKMVDWTRALGPEHVVVGLGVNPGVTNYMTIDQAVSVWKSLRVTYPALLGTYDWKVDTDRAQGWPFATQMVPLVAR